jgi:hypothetical protein
MNGMSTGRQTAPSESRHAFASGSVQHNQTKRPRPLDIPQDCLSTTSDSILYPLRRSLPPTPFSALYAVLCPLRRLSRSIATPPANPTDPIRLRRHHRHRIQVPHAPRSLHGGTDLLLPLSPERVLVLQLQGYGYRRDRGDGGAAGCGLGDG